MSRAIPVIKRLFHPTWIMLVFIVLAIILIPFLFASQQIELWTAQFIHVNSSNRSFMAFVLSILLALDIFLPVPSSIISTASGFLLGFMQGTLVSFVGMTAGCICGYFTGKSSRLIVKTFDKQTLQRLENFFNRFGAWAITLARPVPVLAEATVLFAGMSGMNKNRFIASSTLSNLGISLVYAGLGSYSFTRNSFLIAFAASIIIPLLFKIILWLIRNKDTPKLSR